jgi:hypothetical protein
VCRIALDTDKALQLRRQQWHSPGETSFEVAFVGAGMCTITVQGNGAAYQTVKAQLPMTVVSSHQRRPRISASVRAALLKDATVQARTLKDFHPYDIRAVLTTEAAAAKLTGHEDAGGRGEAYVYFVAMRGNFISACRAARATIAQRCGRGPGYPVMVMTVLASDDEVERKDYPESYPELKSLGTPFRLSTRGQ